MIKTNELRVGNLVYIINRNSEVHLPNKIPFKVLTIGLDVECLMYKIKPVTVEKWNKYYYKDLSSIEVTDKTLENLGFYLDYDGGHYRRYCINGNDDCFRFYVTLDSEGCNYYISDFGTFKHIKGVHQLQNLYFALTGCELQYVA